MSRYYPVVSPRIEPHPNVDGVEIAYIDDYRCQCVVKKGQFKNGQLVIYVPEESAIPKWLLCEMGMWDEAKNKGMLGGRWGSVVKATELHGVLSKGLLIGKGTYCDKKSGTFFELAQVENDSRLYRVFGDLDENGEPDEIGDFNLLIKGENFAQWIYNFYDDTFQV